MLRIHWRETNEKKQNHTAYNHGDKFSDISTQQSRYRIIFEAFDLIK